MVFEKGSRICLINVRESALKTHVEIYVAPRVGGMQPATEFKLNKWYGELDTRQAELSDDLRGYDTMAI